MENHPPRVHAARRLSRTRRDKATLNPSLKSSNLDSMSALTQSETVISWDEYLAGELLAEARHEFVNGQVYAMSGASDNHGRIAGNVFALLHSHLKGNPCEPFGSDMKLRVQAESETLGYYPDVMVVCDPGDNNRYFRERPTVLFEVVSQSTERLDKREKLLAYKTIPSLQEYVILEQSRPGALVYRRSASWKPEGIEGPEGTVRLDSLGCSLAFADLYARVEWRPETPRQPWEI